MFDTAGGVLVNELAMRPHNSGHWTIEGARTSQFEQHLRAVLDLPLGDTRMTAPHVVMANVLGGEIEDMYAGYLHCLAHDPGVRIHMYGKGYAQGERWVTSRRWARMLRTSGSVPGTPRPSCEETSMSTAG